MSLCITTGRFRDCSRPISGGLATVYLADRKCVDSIAQDANDAVTGVTMVDPLTDFFYKFEFKPDSASFAESITNENCSTLATQTLTMSFVGRSQADIQTIKELLSCCCGLTAIVFENQRDTSGDKIGRFFGFEDTEELFLTGVEGTTGVLKSDANEFILTFTATATQPADTYTGGEASIPTP